MLVRGPNYMYYDINGDEISYVKLWQNKIENVSVKNSSCGKFGGKI
jgi:hypothetical protein